MTKLQVIIADDAPFIRDVLKHILKRGGHEVVGEAEDGEQAVQLAKEKKPDLIIMDIVMPNKSGVQATKEILELLPKTKVIACSTLDQDNMVMKVMEAGACEYLKKPFDAKEVLKIIERVFEKKSGEKK